MQILFYIYVYICWFVITAILYVSTIIIIIMIMLILSYVSIPCHFHATQGVSEMVFSVLSLMIETLILASFVHHSLKKLFEQS